MAVLVEMELVACSSVVDTVIRRLWRCGRVPIGSRCSIRRHTERLRDQTTPYRRRMRHSDQMLARSLVFLMPPNGMIQQ